CARFDGSYWYFDVW
nr:immunoglobulin heavy chain junction region [Mus musculus]